MKNTTIDREKIAARTGQKPEDVLVGLDDLPADSARDEDWILKYLTHSPVTREAYEKGTITFELRGDWIIPHYTPDYYLDLMERLQGRERKDPWTAGQGGWTEYIEPGYDFAKGRDDPGNRAWAVGRCKRHEEAIANSPLPTGRTRLTNSIAPTL